MITNAHIAILGATGAVGQEFIRLIEERNVPYERLTLLASSRSAGKKILRCLPAAESAERWPLKRPHGEPSSSIIRVRSAWIRMFRW